MKNILYAMEIFGQKMTEFRVFINAVKNGV